MSKWLPLIITIVVVFAAAWLIRRVGNTLRNELKGPRR